MTAAVPTIWLMLLAHMEANNLKLSTLRRVLIGGSACPRAMIEKFEKNYGVTVAHAWGMTEMNPIGSICAIKPDYDANDFEKILDVKVEAGRGAVHRRDEDRRRQPTTSCPGTARRFGRLKVRGAAVAQVVLQGRGRRDPRRERLLRYRRRRDHRSVRQPADHRPLQGRDQVRRRVDFLDRSGEPRGRPSEGDGGRGDRHPPSEMGRAAAADHHPEEGREPDARGNARLHGRQDRQVVDAGRRGVRERDSAHRHGQDPEDRAARPVQGLHAADRGGAPNSGRKGRPR